MKYNIRFAFPMNVSSYVYCFTPVGMKIHLMPGTQASQKGLLDAARDPPGFNAGMIDTAYFS